MAGRCHQRPVLDLSEDGRSSARRDLVCLRQLIQWERSFQNLGTIGRSVHQHRDLRDRMSFTCFLAVPSKGVLMHRVLRSFAVLAFALAAIPVFAKGGDALSLIPNDAVSV